MFKPFCETGNNLSESSQLRIKAEASKGDPVVGVCYTSPDQGEGIYLEIRNSGS